MKESYRNHTTGNAGLSKVRLAQSQMVVYAAKSKLKKKRKRGSASTRVAEALRMAAASMRHSQTALGAYYRQIARRIGADVAVFATARKLATLIFRMLRWGQPYVDEGAQAYEKRYREARLRRLTASAADLGYELILKPANA